MNYSKIKILQLNQIPNNKELLLFLAKLLSKTGFYEQKFKINYPHLDYLELIIEKFVIPYKDGTSIITYKDTPIGFYAAQLIEKSTEKKIIIPTPKEQITWHNLGSSIMKLYDLYFKNQEFLLDNVALIDEFQGKGIFRNITFPVLKSKAYELNASAIVLSVFEGQNNPAYQLYLREGFQEIAVQEYELEAASHPKFGVIDKITDKLIFLRLPLSSK